MGDSVSGDIDREERYERARERLGLAISDVGELVEIAGMGGMAAVYRAERPDGTPVAVKLMHRNLADKEKLRERFVREAKVLDQADHRNAVQVYSTGELDTGEAYIAMEWLDGVEVDILWKRLDFEFPPIRAFSIAEQVLDCLVAYHESGVLHRDVKPANLFVTQDGLVKLIDFGLARFRVEGQTPTRDGAALGTPAYMAPEQALGKQDLVDERTDVFGVGATLFALLSGQTVHDTEAASAALVQAATNQPESLGYHVEDLDDDFVEIVDRAIEWDRTDRYQSAEAMHEAVETALERREKSSREREESVALSPEETREVRAPDPDDPQKLGAALRNIERLVDRAPTDSNIDDAARRLEHAAQQIRELAAERGRRLQVEIRPYGFALDGETAVSFDESLQGVPFRLYEVGAREIAFHRDVTVSELETVGEWLAEIADDEFETDDPVAAIWDSRTPRIEVRAAGQFRKDAIEASPASDFATYLLDGKGRWNRPSDSGRRTEGGDAAVRASTASFLRAPKGVLSRSDAKVLKQLIDTAGEAWNDRAARLLVQAWRERRPADDADDPAPAHVAVTESLMDAFSPKSMSEVLLHATDRVDDDQSAFLETLLHDTSVGPLVDTILEADESTAKVSDATRQNIRTLVQRHPELGPAESTTAADSSTRNRE